MRPTALFLFIALFANAQNKNGRVAATGFIENKGQIVTPDYKANTQVKYLLCTKGLNVQLRQTGFSYDTYFDTKDSNISFIQPGYRKVHPPVLFTRHFHRVDVELLNCNPNASLEASNESSAYFNYFTAGTPQGGIINVHCYQTVLYKNIYPNIDMQFIALPGKPEYDFILHKGANVNDIKLQYKGMDSALLINNELDIKTSAGKLKEHIPSSYFADTKQNVAVKYISVDKNIFSFNLPKNISIESDLVIDPSIMCLEWGSYYGGNNTDYANAFGLDSIDNLYIGGTTTSPNNIATAGAYQTTFGGGHNDCFLAKFDSTGTALRWGTYYGGSGDEEVLDLRLDKNDNIFFVGYSNSATGVATPGAYKTSYTGGTSNNALVAEFNSTGTSLIWASYYGGGGPDIAFNLAIDSINNIFITGYTYSGTGIGTPGTYQPAYAGGQDSYVAKFNSTGTSLLWATYYGGPAVDAGYGLVLDKKNDVYLTGQTNSSTGISTAGTYQTTFGGNQDAFVAEFDPTGSTLIEGTYYGGSGNDLASWIMLDTSGNIYVAGQTTSTSAIATPGAYQTINGGGTDICIAKFNAACTSLLWGTYYGGAGDDYVSNIEFDGYGNIWFSGQTNSTSSIATTGVYQTTLAGGDDALLAKINSTGSALVAATYYGGAGIDEGSVIHLDNKLNAYLTGTTTSAGGIATAGEYQTTYGGGTYDAFVAKFSCNCDLTSINVGATSYAICIGDSVSLSAAAVGSNRVVYSWSPGGQTNTTITVKPSSTTTYYITVRDTIGHCFKEDSVTVTVNPIPVASITGNTYICNGNSTTLTASGGNSYLWSNGATNSIITVSPSSLTSYSVYVTQNGCTDSAYTSVFVNPLPVITACCDTSIMAGQSVQLTSSGGATYSWSPSSGLSCNNCPNPIASPNNTTTYILTVTSDSGCFSSETITVDVTCGQVFVPEAFSPNGDGQNDILYVRGDCIKTMQFDVFDRWGNKVFATDDKSIGWNGTYKGQPMNTGSYSYVVTATMFDGSNMIKKGSVALVR